MDEIGPSLALLLISASLFGSFKIRVQTEINYGLSGKLSIELSTEAFAACLKMFAWGAMLEY